MTTMPNTQTSTTGPRAAATRRAVAVRDRGLLPDTDGVEDDYQPRSGELPAAGGDPDDSGEENMSKTKRGRPAAGSDQERKRQAQQAKDAAERRSSAAEARAQPRHPDDHGPPTAGVGPADLAAARAAAEESRLDDVEEAATENPDDSPGSE